MKKYQDIQINDVSLRSQFVQYWLNGDYARAWAIINNNPQLDSKAFQASVFNLITAAIINLENKFYQGVTQELQVVLTNYNEAINQFVKRADWNNQTQYKTGNFVMYNNEIYLAKQDNINIIPTDTTYWVYIGLRGDNGADGINVNLRYNWSANNVYQVNDVVLYGTKMYVAINQNSGQNPSTTTGYWAVFLNLPKAEIVISAQPPSADLLYDGLIWCKIINN